MNIFVYFLVFICFILSLLLIFTYGRQISENFSVFSNKIPAFFSSVSKEANPPPRFKETDLNSVIRYPVNGAESYDCPNCEIPEHYTPQKTTPLVEEEQPQPQSQSVVVDRLIFANRNSQLRAMGDPIRGDLPIVPNPPGWFTPSVTPQIDLQRGALNYLAGFNTASQQLENLFAKSESGELPTSKLPFSALTGNAYAQLGNRGQDLTIISQL